MPQIYAKGLTRLKVVWRHCEKKKMKTMYSKNNNNNKAKRIKEKKNDAQKMNRIYRQLAIVKMREEQSSR